jgi:glycosyltransferase involved in cell wall biosynthesis
MRIVHVAPFYHPSVGGGEIHLKALSERLVQRGHRVTVLTQRHTSDSRSVDRTLGKSEVINGVLVRRFAPRLQVSDLVRGCLKVRGGYRLLRALFGTSGLTNFPDAFLPGAVLAAVRARPDVILVENWGSPGIVWQFAALRALRRSKLVGMPLFHTEDGWSHNPLLAEMIGRYDAMVALTEHERAFILGQSGGDRPTYVVGCGVDPSAFAERHGARIRDRYGLQGRPVVGFIGRLHVTKGVAYLLAAMDTLWKSDDDVRVLLAGRADADTNQLLAGLSADARARVVVVGEFPEQEKASLFEAIDVLVVPSRAESFGIVYLEAWACRRPVIGASGGAVACVIQDGVDGLLVDPTDPSKLAGAIQSLLSDPARRRRMADAGHQKSLRLTSDRVAEQMENVYLTVVQRRQENGHPH